LEEGLRSLELAELRNFVVEHCIAEVGVRCIAEVEVHCIAEMAELHNSEVGHYFAVAEVLHTAEEGVPHIAEEEVLHIAEEGVPHIAEGVGHQLEACLHHRCETLLDYCTSSRELICKLEKIID